MKYLFLAISLCIVACHKIEKDDAGQVRYYERSKVFTDPDNGCQYIASLSDNSSFTPMVNADGTPKCKKGKG